MQDGFVPESADGLSVAGSGHGGGCAAGFEGLDEGCDQGLPCRVRVGGLCGVDFGLGVVIYFGPEIADVMALGAVVLFELS